MRLVGVSMDEMEAIFGVQSSSREKRVKKAQNPEAWPEVYPVEKKKKKRLS